MRRLILPLLLCGLLLLSCGGKTSKPGTRSEVIIGSVQLQRGSEVRYMLARPKEPKNVLILLFPGGDGRCHFGTEADLRSVCSFRSSYIELGGGMWVSYNFVARNLINFSSRGHVVVIADVPSDLRAVLETSSEPKIVASVYRVGGDWDRDGYDEPTDIVKDIEAVVSEVESRLSVSFSEIFLVGTSRGTLASAYLSHKLSGVSGSVLTATLSSDTRYSSYCPGGASNFMDCTGINSFRGRILLVHHINDGCPASSYASAYGLFSSLTNGSFTKVTGGSEPSSSPCKAKTYHGFWEKDAEVVKLILDWIEGLPIPGKI